jgi:hypothetical protein
VESVLLDLPLPVVYLAEEPNGRELVVDGQQRLTALLTFLEDKWPLAGLRLHSGLNGKYFRDLDRLTRLKLRRASLRVTTILKDSDNELKFEIFERLNTGSVALNDQELRNCIYRGGYNVLLRKMAADTDFMALLGLTEPERRMRDVELVLRFAAFFHAENFAYQAPLRTFLSEEMARYQHIDHSDAVHLWHAFRNSVQLVRDMLGPQALRRFRRGGPADPNGAWEDRFNAALYEVLMCGFTLYPRHQSQPHLATLREALLWLMTEDEEFIAALEGATSAPWAVEARFGKWLEVMKTVVGTGRPTSSVRARKQEILSQQNECFICGQPVAALDDATIIGLSRFLPEEYELSQQLRLAHRFCKWHQVRLVRGAGNG